MFISELDYTQEHAKINHALRKLHRNRKMRRRDVINIIALSHAARLKIKTEDGAVFSSYQCVGAPIEITPNKLYAARWLFSRG